MSDPDRAPAPVPVSDAAEQGGEVSVSIDGGRTWSEPERVAVQDGTFTVRVPYAPPTPRLGATGSSLEQSVCHHHEHLLINDQRMGLIERDGDLSRWEMCPHPMSDVVVGLFKSWHSPKFGHCVGPSYAVPSDAVPVRPAAPGPDRALELLRELVAAYGTSPFPSDAWNKTMAEAMRLVEDEGHG